MMVVKGSLNSYHWGSQWLRVSWTINADARGRAEAEATGVGADVGFVGVNMRD